MTKIQTLEQSVRALYDARNPEREGWADWLAENHVFLVANVATQLAQQVGADKDLARAGALLHDIADVKMSRFNEAHETTSLAIARDLMQQAGFTADEIAITVDDGIRLHGCHDGQVPENIVGKVLATADAKVHLLSDFYPYVAWVKGKEGKTLEFVKQLVLKKLERDFHSKIQFEDVREECRPAYTVLKLLFRL